MAKACPFYYLPDIDGGKSTRSSSPLMGVRPATCDGLVAVDRDDGRTRADDVDPAA